MRKSLLVFAVAACSFIPNANAFWGLNYVSSTDTWTPDPQNCGAGLCVNEGTSYNLANTAGAHSNIASTVTSYINPADTTNSWIQYTLNIKLGSTPTRDVVIFRNPQSLRMAPVIKSLQDQLAAGKRLYLIRNLTSSKASTGGWDGYNGNSYEVNPGDKLMMSFR